MTIRPWVDRLVDLGGRRPVAVVTAAVMMLISCWWYASHLEIRSDLRELLPRDSPGFQSFERRLARVGGSATLFVVCESPDRLANQRFIDAVADALGKMEGHRELISSVESGTKDLRAFFQANKWLYASVADLEEADTTLDRQIAVRSGMV